MSTETRLSSVEQQLEDVTARLGQLEGASGLRPASSARSHERQIREPEPRQEVAPRRHESESQLRPISPPRTPRSATDLEELFGGRILAWVGGLAILLGAVLFMAMAIGNGWIDEATRTVIAFLGSSTLLVAGVWLHERKGHTEAARAAVASSLAGLYATLLVATQSYGLIDAGLGLAAAALVAAASLVIAVRWDSSVVAAIGVLGALGAPILVGTGTSDLSIAFVALSLVATVGILLWRRWDWLALAGFLVSAPQLIEWGAQSPDDRLAVVLAVIVGFWALYVIAALGHEVRARGNGLMSIASWLLLFGAAALVSGLGYFLLTGTGEDSAAVAWILWLSAVHVLLGGLALRLRLNFEIGSMLVGIGLGLSALGLAEALDGPALVAAWAVESVVLAFLASRIGAEGESGAAERLAFAAGGFLGLGLIHVIALEAPPTALLHGVGDLGGALVGLGLCAAAALAAGRLLRDLDPAIETVAGFAAAGLLVYLGSVAIVDSVGVSETGEAIQSGQVWLSVFWTVTGLGAVVAGLIQRSRSVRIGGLALLSLAVTKVWTYDLSELDEIARVLSFIGLGLLLLVGAFAYQRIRPRSDDQQAGAEA